MRLQKEKGSLQEGIQALQGIFEEFDAKVKALGGGKGISNFSFIEGLQAVINATNIPNLESIIKGRSRSPIWT